MSKKNSIVLNHKSCFEKSKRIQEIYKNFKSQITKFKSNKFLAAISGGPDSLALAAMSKVYENENKRKKFYYAIVNHGIRNNAKAECLFVKKILKKHGINIKIITNKRKIKKNIQHLARKVRYEALINECKRKNIKNLLVAHHREDQIETFLIRLSRGSGVQGLSAMSDIYPTGRGIKILRPFLNTKKIDLIYVSKKVFGSFIKDPSNNSQKFLRVRVRKLLPILKKSGIAEEQIIKSINHLKTSNNTINRYIDQASKKVFTKRKKEFLVKYKEFLLLNYEIQIKLLGRIVKKLTGKDYPPRSKKLSFALNLINANHKKRYLFGGCLMRNDGRTIFIRKIT